MTALAWPSAAKIARLDLRIATAARGGVSPLNGRQFAGAMRAEFWAGTVVLASTSRANLATISAFVEQLRGRSGTFALPLAGGFANHVAPSNGTIVEALAQAGTMRVNFTTTGQTLKAGTLMRIDGVSTAGTQLVECLEDVTTAADTIVKIAPRLRKTFTASTAVTAVDVTARFRLADDEAGAAPFGLAHGAAVLEIIEAVAG